MATAFISHASEDREVAERICSFLEKRGIVCWIAPRDVRPGHRYGEEIVGAIEAANAVVLILSENANNSKFVEREIERAVSYGKPTLPVRVREVRPSRSLELFISDAHWIDAWKPPMEQYLDRLADSIRLLSPGNTGMELKRSDGHGEKIANSEQRFSAAKYVGIGAAIVLLIGVGIGAAWFLSSRQTAGPSQLVSQSTPGNSPAKMVEASPEPQAIVQSTPEVTVPLVTPARETAAPATPSPAIAMENKQGPPAAALTEVLAELGNATGTRRYQLIKQNADRLPAQITTSDLLTLLDGTAYRNEAIQSLIRRLPNQLPVDDLLRIMGSTTGGERYALIGMLVEKLPAKITVDNLLALINGSIYRNEAIKSMLGRLPNPLSVEDTLRIFGSTSGGERYALIGMLVEKLPAKITVDNLLALINGSIYRNNAIKSMLGRLPNPLPVEDTLRIFGSSTGGERYALIGMFTEKLPVKISVDDMLTLINGSIYRNEAIKSMASRLPDPIPVADLERILGTADGGERYQLLGIIASRAPVGLSSAQISDLVGTSLYPDQARALFRR